MLTLGAGIVTGFSSLGAVSQKTTFVSLTCGLLQRGDYLMYLLHQIQKGRKCARPIKVTILCGLTVEEPAHRLSQQSEETHRSLIHWSGGDHTKL